VARRYQTRKETVAEALRFIREMPHLEAGREGFVLVTRNPADELVERMGYAKGGANGLVRDLKAQGLVEYVANGGEKKESGQRGHAWLVKLADNQNERLKLDTSNGKEFALPEWFNDFRSFCQSVSGLPEKLETALRENANLKAQKTKLQGQVAELEGELEDYRAESEHFRQMRDAMKKLIDKD
jgi:hypothetical protein